MPSNLLQGKHNHMYELDFSCSIAILKMEFSILWYKLIKSGVDGILFAIIRPMYDGVKFCVKHMNSVSDFFQSNLGLF